jgi:hypothetical protein
VVVFVHLIWIELIFKNIHLLHLKNCNSIVFFFFFHSKHVSFYFKWIYVVF